MPIPAVLGTIGTIASLGSSAAGGIAKMLAPKPVPYFTSQAEYNTAKAEYLKSGEGRRLELEPALNQWEDQQGNEAMRQERVNLTLQRLGEGESRGVQTLQKSYGASLASRGLRGTGEIYQPLNVSIEDLRRGVAEQRKDIMMSEAETKALQAQALKRANLMQRLQQKQTETELWGQGIGLGLGVAGELRPGGLFGGKTAAETAQEELNQMYKSQFLNQYKTTSGIMGGSQTIPNYALNLRSQVGPQKWRGDQNSNSYLGKFGLTYPTQ